MTEVLSHPKQHKDFAKAKFTYADGSVEISVPEGEHLTVSKALFLLKLAETEIITKFHK